MDARDGFIKEFEDLLRIPRDYSLEQWQYVYKHVVFSMGMNLLEKFKQDVFGRNPFNPPGPNPSGGTTSPGKGRHPEKQGAGPGPGGGVHPHAVVVCVLNGVLELVPPPDGDPEKKIEQ